jgi:hypothetical protein
MRNSQITEPGDFAVTGGVSNRAWNPTSQVLPAGASNLAPASPGRWGLFFPLTGGSGVASFFEASQAFVRNSTGGDFYRLMIGYY